MTDKPKPTRLEQAIERFKNSGGFWGSAPTDDVIECLMILAGAYVESQYVVAMIERLAKDQDFELRHEDVFEVSGFNGNYLAPTLTEALRLACKGEGV